MEILELIGRKDELFRDDIIKHEKKLCSLISSSTFLVIGGAGTIGKAVTREIFKRNPAVLHIVDISENNLVELVRDLRSSLGYTMGEFKTFAIDCGSLEFEIMFNTYGPYDYVLNLSALKHVRSEKDPFSLMRMINVNILNVKKTLDLASNGNGKKYFCVSTDKAANPVNMMGGSKRIMELVIMNNSMDTLVSSARFANVAFSDGSLLYGFDQRIKLKQPIAAPKDIKRYFVTPKESGELCLMSCLLGEDQDIFFPRLSEDLNLIKFSEIAVKYLNDLGYEPYVCENEDEARRKIHELIKRKKWPCCFFDSDTSGEKNYEEFFTANENIDLERYSNIGIIKGPHADRSDDIIHFMKKINRMKENKKWSKKELVDLFNFMIPEFKHKDTGKDLDSKM